MRRDLSHAVAGRMITIQGSRELVTAVFPEKRDGERVVIERYFECKRMSPSGKSVQIFDRSLTNGEILGSVRRYGPYYADYHIGCEEIANAERRSAA